VALDEYHDGCGYGPCQLSSGIRHVISRYYQRVHKGTYIGDHWGRITRVELEELEVLGTDRIYYRHYEKYEVF